LTRAEAKSVTRARLLEAAGKVLAAAGYGGLSVSAVAREAGVAQPTFYVHFRDKDELLRALGEAEMGMLRQRVRQARERFIAGAGVDAVRETFRIPLQTWVEHPELLRLHMQELRQPGSPIGAMMRQLREEFRRDLADDLVRLGLPAASAAEREELQLIAEAMLAQTETLALFYLDGACSNLDTVVEVLTRFAVGVIGFGPQR
jgi:AcrR family transcriptional regulator